MADLAKEEKEQKLKDEKLAEAEETKEEKDAREKKEKEPEKPPPRLNKGPYVVHVHIIECRELKGRGVGAMSDPVTKVEVMGVKQYTKIHKTTLSPFFDEVLIFEYRDLLPEQVESGKILIKVLDANTFRKDVLIGSYEFDVAKVYYRPNHEYYRQWTTLFDTTGEHEGIQGYLKVSVVVLGPGDEQVVHSEKDINDEAEDQMGILMPPEVEQHGHQLDVNVLYAQDLPIMDFAPLGFRSKCDPYVQVEFAGQKLKTDAKAGLSVSFLQSIQIPVMEPTMSHVIRVTCWDYDQGNNDDRINTITFDYNDITAKGGYPAKWYPLYGAPEGEQNSKNAKLMNKSLIPGSAYRGRLMLSLNVSHNERAKKDVVTCNGLLPEELKALETRYKIELDLYEGSELPDRGDMFVELSCATKSIQSRSVAVNDGVADWTQVFKEFIIDLPKDPLQCPDVFIYLCDKKKRRLSFVRFKMVDLVKKGWKIPPTWTTLYEDKAIDPLGETEFPGALLLSLRAGYLEAAPKEVFPECRPLRSKTPGEFPAMDPEVPTGPVTVPNIGTLKVFIDQASDLPSMDVVSSDPYCKVAVTGQKVQKTEVKKGKLNPQWRQTFEFKDVALNTRLTLTLLDENTLLADEKMGEISVLISDLHKAAGVKPGESFTHTTNGYIDPKKYPKARLDYRVEMLMYSLEDCQKQQASVALREKTAREWVMDKMAGPLGRVLRKPCQLRVHLYQGRHLPAADDNGLCDPYVVVFCAGKKIRFSTKLKTLNPAWYETQIMNLSLPIISLAPRVQVAVFDWDATTPDDSVARCAITFQDILAENKKDTSRKYVPTWWDLTDFEGSPIPEAKLLIGFELLTPDEVQKAGEIKSIRPETIPKQIEIVTLGLRNLQSTLGVHKSYVQFDLSDGKRFGTRSSSVPTTTNPNFLQVVAFDVNLPKRSVFAPFLNIEARDMIFGGAIKRLLGKASVDLSSLMNVDEKTGFWTPKQREIPPEIKKRDQQLMAKIKQTFDGETKAIRDKKEAEAAEKVRAAQKKEERQREISQRIDERKRAQMAANPPETKYQRYDEPREITERKGKGDYEEIPDIEESKIVSKKSDTEMLPGLFGDHEEEKKTDDFDDEKQGFVKYDVSKELKEDADEEPSYMRGRVTVDNELEDVMNLSPFDSITLTTGQDKPGLLGTKLREVGTYKGVIQILESKAKSSIRPTDLFPQQLFCRVYILRGLNLAPKDSDGSSDPYLTVKVGKKEVSTRDRHFKKDLNPDFYESFEFPVTLPGDANLNIKVWDWDGLGDDLIGETNIDLEDRWFSPGWREVAEKQLIPAEWRTLHIKSSLLASGKLQLWVELFTTDQAKTRPFIEIKPPPPEPWEMRVIIWGCRDVTIKDEITNQNDLYITCSCSAKGLKQQETDTHFRSKKGKGNFNWRCKFPLSFPMKTWPRLRFQIWDFDFFSFNDSICEVTLSLRGMCKRAMKKKDRIKMFVNGEDKFWLTNLKHPNFKGNQGKMQISIEMLPLHLAESLPAGLGRSAPNSNPFLPEPEGRVNWSLFHPLDMLKEILGPELYRKIWMWLITILCLAVLFYMLPQVISTVIANTITG